MRIGTARIGFDADTAGALVILLTPATRTIVGVTERCFGRTLISRFAAYADTIARADRAPGNVGAIIVDPAIRDAQAQAADRQCGRGTIGRRGALSSDTREVGATRLPDIARSDVADPELRALLFGGAADLRVGFGTRNEKQTHECETHDDLFDLTLTGLRV